MINVAEEFSPFPAGRYRSDGPYSGERFREEILVPKLATGNKLIINLIGTMGIGSSFLEEAFGGLVREKGFKPKVLKESLEIRSSLPTYQKEIWQYIEQA